MDENKEQKDQLEKSLLNKILHGEVEMKPKYFFVFKYFLIISAIITLFLLSAWFANFLFYKLRTQNLWGYLSFGDAGIHSFFYNIPLGAIFISVIALGLGLVLFRKFDISYKRNFPLLIALIVGVIIGFAFTIDKMELNEKLDNRNGLWIIYHHQIINPDWIVGSVIYRDSHSYYINSVDGRFFKVVPANKSVHVPLFNRSDCIEVRGIIINQNTFEGYQFFKCPYRIFK